MPKKFLIFSEKNYILNISKKKSLAQFPTPSPKTQKKITLQKYFTFFQKYNLGRMLIKHKISYTPHTLE